MSQVKVESLIPVEEADFGFDADKASNKDAWNNWQSEVFNLGQEIHSGWGKERPQQWPMKQPVSS